MGGNTCCSSAGMPERRHLGMGGHSPWRRLTPLHMPACHRRACCLLMPRAGVGCCLRRAVRIGGGGT
eukprot:12243071-Alexandrium_andersonii.AAC.1